MEPCPYTRGVDSVGSVVLIAVTVAVGLAFVTGVVQLWRHQPVHHDQATSGPDEDTGPDEETVALPRDDEESGEEPDGDDGSADDGSADETTVDLRGADRPPATERGERGTPQHD